MNKHKKYLICATTAISLLFSQAALPVAYANETVFNDLPENHENYYAIKYLKEVGVVSGTSPETFEPDANINRAAALKIILAGLEIYDANNDPSGYDILEPVGINYSDITERQWYVPYVRYATENKIIDGYQDGTFGPDKKMNKAEALKIVVSAYQLDEKININVEKKPFLDVGKDEWYAKFFAFAKDKNLILADDNGNVNPGELITRGELSELIYRLSIIKESGAIHYDLATNWPREKNTQYGLEYPIPPGWEKVETADSIVLWKRDAELAQKNYFRLYPKSSKLIIYLQKEDDYFFDKMRNTYGDGYTIAVKLENSTGTAESINTYDKYFDIKNGTYVVMHLEVGDSNIRDKNLLIGKSIISSSKIIGEPVAGDDTQIKLSEIRKAINVDEEGQKHLDTIADKIVIHTDTIGVGTGPVDYYYSPSLNVTIKYERSFDVILDIQEGKSYKF